MASTLIEEQQRLIDTFHESPIASGKTKLIHQSRRRPDEVLLVAKNDLTAGDGAKHDVIIGKAEWATRTTCNVFRLLKQAGIPVAFNEEFALPSQKVYGFFAPRCTMLPYEVVVRREAHGSYLKRAPHLKKGHLFPRLLVEFFLKTNGKKFKEYTLVKDDPLLDIKGPDALLYDPTLPNQASAPAHPFLTLKVEEIFSQPDEDLLLKVMEEMARRTFLVLEKAWQLLGRRLVDFKVEFGIGPKGELLLADVIDNDSWRVLENGKYIDKQVYRDGGALDEVAEKYRRVADLTDRFGLPTQQLLLWRGSTSDKLDPFLETLRRLLGINSPALESISERLAYGTQDVRVQEVTCSVHKEPELACQTLRKFIQEIPDTVIIAYVGMSNGAGPTLSAHTSVPVITVPATLKEFPDDVWSSLRTPSNVPVSTILNPANAVQHALQILAMRNPAVYRHLRYDLEERLPQGI